MLFSFLLIYLYYQKHMAIIFALCTLAALAIMLLCTHLSSFYPDPTDFLIWFTIGNVINARWEEDLNETFLKYASFPHSSVHFP